MTGKGIQVRLEKKGSGLNRSLLFFPPRPV